MCFPNPLRNKKGEKEKPPQAPPKGGDIPGGVS